SWPAHRSASSSIQDRGSVGQEPLRARFSDGGQHCAPLFADTRNAVIAVVWGLAEKKTVFSSPSLPLGSRMKVSSVPKKRPIPRLPTARPRLACKGFVLQKPNGLLTPRVQATGAEHFGIVAIDCAKHRSRYFLADFYGNVLLAPATLLHSRGDFQAAIRRIRLAIQQHDLI